MEPVEVDLTDPVAALAERNWQTAVLRHRENCAPNSEICNPSVFHQTLSLDRTHRWVKDYKLDGVIMNRALSCRAGTVGQVFFKNELAKDGIPSLIFESDMTDPRSWADAHIKAQFTEFLETVAAAQERRQKA